MNIRKCKIFMSQNVPLFIKMKNLTAKSNLTSTKKITLLYENTSRSRTEFMFKAITAPVYSGQPFGSAPRPGPKLRLTYQKTTSKYIQGLSPSCRLKLRVKPVRADVLLYSELRVMAEKGTNYQGGSP